VHTVAASLAAQTITFAAPASPAVFNSTFAVAPTASSGLTVTVLATGGCSVATGTVTMTSGTTDCVLTASQAGDANYSPAADVIQTVTAAKAAQAAVTLTLPPTDSIGAPGLQAIGAGGSGSGAFTYASSTPGVCTVALSTGNITALTPGSCTITATRAADADYLVASSAPQSFTITAGAATQLAFTTQPVNAIAGQGLTLVVTALDAGGNTATSFTGGISLAVASGPGALFGYAPVTAANGVATFTGTGLNLHTAGTYQLTASASGLTDATTGSFDIVAANAHHLTYTTYPTSVTAAAPFVVTLELRDIFDNVKIGFDDDVVLSIASGTGTTGAQLSGTLTQFTVDGVVSFTGLSIDLAGSGYQLSADFGFGVPIATGSTFTVTP
jgi:hypothetical protein